MASAEALLRAEVVDLKGQLARETRRANQATEELRLAKEQNLAVHKQVEQEEEYITNKLMKRLEQLKKEKQMIANEVEQEEEFLTNTLYKKLEKLNKEKVEMENQLEAEQEYIVNKLQKQVESLGKEKTSMKQERSKLQLQIDELTGSVMKLATQKVRLEQDLESEEELIVNRMQRQIDVLVENYCRLEKALRAHHVQVAESDLLPMPFMLKPDPRLLGRWSPPGQQYLGLKRTSDPLCGWRSRSLSVSPHRSRESRRPVMEGERSDSARNRSMAAPRQPQPPART